MKILPLILLSVFASGIASAEPPISHRPDRYKDLYLNSAITDDPPPPEQVVDKKNELEDWTLVGLSKYVGRVEVEIMHKKDRKRVSIPSPEADELGFSIKGLEQGGDYVEDSKVTLKQGKFTGEVTFDPTYLTLKKLARPTKGAKGSKSSIRARTPNKNSSSRPPIPGSRTSTSNSNKRSAIAPSRVTRVPRPTTNAATNTSGTSTVKKRARWSKPTK